LRNAHDIATNTNIATFGNELKMKINYPEGFDLTKTVACDSVGGTLRALEGGRVYKVTEKKDMPKAAYNLGSEITGKGKSKCF
jgi:hypothetical protein